MANAAAAEEEGGLDHLEETDGGQTGRPEGRATKFARYIKLHAYLPLKEVLTLDEMHLKFMRQGVDVSRSRLLSEGIKLLEKAVSDGKFDLRGGS